MATAAVLRPDTRGTDAFREAVRGVLAVMPGGQTFTVSGIDWPTYESMLAVRDDDRPGLRMAYHRGVFEAMTTSRMHELWKTVLAALIDILILELGLRFAPCGEITIRRRDLDRGVEPDLCYYARHAPRVMPAREIDFATDPPPDLAVEIEYTRTVLDRLDTYAAFRVPEVWRYDGTTLTVLLLHPDNSYQPAAASRTFPTVPLGELNRFLGMAGTTDYFDILAMFRDWVRQTLVPPPTV